MMNLEEQIRLHKEISKRIEVLEQKRKELGLIIMQAMTDTTLQLGGYLVKRFCRLSITTTLEQARSHNAVKLEEVVDKDKIKMLYKSGNPVAGVKEIEFIQIREGFTTETREGINPPNILM